MKYVFLWQCMRHFKPPPIKSFIEFLVVGVKNLPHITNCQFSFFSILLVYFPHHRVGVIMMDPEPSPRRFSSDVKRIRPSILYIMCYWPVIVHTIISEIFTEHCFYKRYSMKKGALRHHFLKKVLKKRITNFTKVYYIV